MGSLPPTQIVPESTEEQYQAVKKHPAHYTGRHIVLKVEDILFRIEQSLLCQFDTFRDMFDGAGSHVKDTDEGSTDENPIVLQGITAFEMESLLHVMEARWLKGIPAVNPEQWKAVLHLSTMWENEKLRQFAIDKIDGLKLSPIELLGLATKCRVEKWLKPASVDLCIRATSLSFEEGERLGFRFFAELGKIRERCMAINSTGSTCTNCGNTYSGSCKCCGQQYYRNPNNGNYNYNYNYNYSAPTYCSCGAGSSLHQTALKEKAAQTSVDVLLATGIRPLPGGINTTKLDNTGTNNHHPVFYSGTDITYQIGQTLFRVQEVVLLQFQALPCGILDTSIAKPAFFSDVTEFEMTAALDILDARWFNGNPMFSVEQWKAVLQLATLWNFEELRQFAIGKIEGLKPPPLDSILLARKCNVSQWLSTGYTDLCMRPQPMTAEEGTLLGIGLFADLFRIRESRKSSHCPSCQNWTISINCASCRAATRATVLAAVSKLLNNSQT